MGMTLKLLGRAAGVSSALVFIAGLSLVGATTASAFYPPATPSDLVNNNSLLCLGIQDNNTSWDTTVIQWGCNGNPDQRWTLVPYGSSQFMIENGNGQCLGITHWVPGWGETQSANPNNGAEAVNWGCSPNFANGVIWGVDDYTFKPTIRLMNQTTHKCLGVWQGGVSPGGSVIQWDCNQNNDQNWNLR